MEGSFQVRQLSPNDFEDEPEEAGSVSVSDSSDDSESLSGSEGYADWMPYTWGVRGVGEGGRLSDVDTDEEDVLVEEDSTFSASPRYTYCLAHFPTDDIDKLVSRGWEPRGLSMPIYLLARAKCVRNPPRPTTCIFELREDSDRRKSCWSRSHLYCNCVKCTAVLEGTATQEEWEAWHKARTRWTNRSRRNRARYLKAQVDELAHKVQLKTKRSRLVVAEALELSPQEIQDWDDWAGWEERARAEVLNRFPQLDYTEAHRL